ncbi:MAG: tRNA 2-thiouridine(34) synthase MnmA [Patescibacteria group bacterium]|nr:tRNA 2-thiouridine(34) synthase MnmA [Patescibacteria group bacterium]
MFGNVFKRRKRRILVALSGGVDSSVVALLLKKEGWKVEGVHFLFPLAIDQNNSIASSQVLEKSKVIAKELGIKLQIVDVHKEFTEKVITDFINKHKKGKTPNPCVVCNKQVKFKELIALADSLGISEVATGHYARKVKVRAKFKGSRIKTKWFIKRAKDTFKDQSYFLNRLSSATIRRCKFPLGEYLEKEVQLIAYKSGLPHFTKRESSKGLCFLQGPTGDFLEQHIIEKPGNIVNQDQQVVGKHQGLAKYTIGQRKGIKIGDAGPYFIIAKDYSKNELRISNIGDDPELFKSKIRIRIQRSAKKKFLFLEKASKSGQEFRANLYLKIRYGQEGEQVASLNFISAETVIVNLKHKVRAVTPGQTAVLYDQGGVLIFGGVIE